MAFGRGLRWSHQLESYHHAAAAIQVTNRFAPFSTSHHTDSKTFNSTIIIIRAFWERYANPLLPNKGRRIVGLCVDVYVSKLTRSKLIAANFSVDIRPRNVQEESIWLLAENSFGSCQTHQQSRTSASGRASVGRSSSLVGWVGVQIRRTELSRILLHTHTQMPRCSTFNGILL